MPNKRTSQLESEERLSNQPPVTESLVASRLTMPPYVSPQALNNSSPGSKSHKERTFLRVLAQTSSLSQQHTESQDHHDLNILAKTDAQSILALAQQISTANTLLEFPPDEDNPLSSSDKDQLLLNIESQTQELTNLLPLNYQTNLTHAAIYEPLKSSLLDLWATAETQGDSQTQELLEHILSIGFLK